jgi:CRISPR-associated protein Cas5t
MGESTHLVNDVNLLAGRMAERCRELRGQAFLLSQCGRMTLPVWVDHVGSAGTRFVTGDLKEVASVVVPPAVEEMPRIDPTT